jgi:TRAP-type C4-dicarboxylate transport system permease small subunit
MPGDKIRVVLRAVGKIHDRITLMSFVLAGLALVIFTSVMAWEVAMRYFFNAPTVWAQDVIAISLCASVFFALPSITKVRSHTVITIVTDALSRPWQRRIRMISLVVSVIVLFSVSWLALNETIRQFTFGIQTASSVPIPKWPILTIITYGLLSSMLYLLRQLFDSKA